MLPNPNFSSVYRTVRDSYRRSKGVSVTCLIAHKGIHFFKLCVIKLRNG